MISLFSSFLNISNCSQFFFLSRQKKLTQKQVVLSLSFASTIFENIHNPKLVIYLSCKILFILPCFYFFFLVYSLKKHKLKTVCSLSLYLSFCQSSSVAKISEVLLIWVTNAKARRKKNPMYVDLVAIKSVKCSF